MRQSITDGTGGRADVYNRDPALELVVTCFVEEITQRYDSRSFSNKVNREPRRGASKNPHHWVQFTPSVLQIGAGDSEISTVQCGCRDE